MLRDIVPFPAYQIKLRQKFGINAGDMLVKGHWLASIAEAAITAADFREFQQRFTLGDSFINRNKIVDLHPLTIGS